MALAFMWGFEVDVPSNGYLDSFWTGVASSTYLGLHSPALFAGSCLTDHSDSHQPAAGYGGGGKCLFLTPDALNHWVELQTPADALDGNPANDGLTSYVISFSYRLMSLAQVGGNRMLAFAQDNSVSGNTFRLFEFTQQTGGGGGITDCKVAVKLSTGEAGGVPTYTTINSTTRCFDVNDWHHVVIEVKQHNVSGRFVMYVDGVKEIEHLGKLDNFLTSPAHATDKIGFQQETSNAKFDHIVVYDTLADLSSGLNAKFIQGLMPNDNDSLGGFARAGTSVGSPVGAAWTDVNGHASNNPEEYDAAKYLEASIASSPATDSYSVNMQDRSVVNAAWSPTTIPAVSVINACYSAENGLIGHVKISGNGGTGFTDSAAKDLKSTGSGIAAQHLISEFWIQNPQTTSDWTGADLDNLVIGLKKA